MLLLEIGDFTYKPRPLGNAERGFMEGGQTLGTFHFVGHIAV
jgi:hypothetical protein